MLIEALAPGSRCSTDAQRPRDTADGRFGALVPTVTLIVSAPCWKRSTGR